MHFFNSDGLQIAYIDHPPTGPDIGEPILLIHGKKDRRVPFAQSKTYVDRLKKAGKEHEFFIQPEGDHFFSREEDRLTFLTQMEAFLDKHNPAN
mgnify:CR=1 FL=1